MIGQPRLDHDAGAVAKGLLDFELLDFVHQLCIFKIGNHRLARLKPVQPTITLRDRRRVRFITIDDRSNGGEDIHHLQPRPLTNLEVVKVMRRGDLYRAGALFHIWILIRHNWDAAADDW